MTHDVMSDLLERLRLLIHALSGSPGEPDTPEVLVSQAMAAVGASGGVLGVVRDGAWIEVVTSRGYAHDRIAAFTPLTVGPQYPLTDAVFRREPIWLPTMTDVAARYPLFAGNTLSQALAVLPLLIEDEAIGVLGVGFDDRTHEFTPPEQQFLLTVADICALALHHWQAGAPTTVTPLPCRIHTCAVRTDGTRRAEGLAVLARHLTVASTTAEVSAAAAVHLPAALGAAAAFVGVVEQQTQALVVHTGTVGDPDVASRYARRPLSDHLPMTDATRTNRPVYLTDAADRQHRYPHTVTDAVTIGWTACAAVPIRDRRGRVTGSICVGWATPVEFDAVLRAELDLVAELCGYTVERVLRNNDEHTIVSALRTHVLSALPHHPALDAYAVCRPARDERMGGDFYAGVRLDEHRLGVILGDVAGHGTSVAAEMVQLYTLLRALMTEGMPLDELAARVDRMRHLSGPATAFATAALAIIDTDRHLLSYLHIGHPPMLVRRAHPPEVIPLTDARRPLLGLLDHSTGVGETRFDPGDVLVAYTDGLVERPHQPMDAGTSRLTAALATITSNDARLIARTLLKHTSPKGRAPDDQTLLVITHR